MVGDGKNLADFTSVNNLVQAIKLSLISESGLTGERFNITDGTEHLLWEVVRRALNDIGLNYNLKHIPYQAAWITALVAEITALFTKKKIPVISRYNISQVTRSLTLDISKAQLILGYKPLISTEESLEQFIRWYKERAG